MITLGRFGTLQNVCAPGRNAAHMLIAAFFVKADLFVAGIGLDVWGAALFAWAVVSQSVDSIARGHHLGGYDMGALNAGEPEAARAAASDVGRSRVGLVLVVAGFVLTAAGFFTTTQAGLQGRHEIYAGLGILVAEAVVALALSAVLARVLRSRVHAHQPHETAPAKPCATTQEWSARDEIARLDAMAGVLLGVAVTGTAAAVTFAGTADHLDHDVKITLFVLGLVLVVPAVLSLLAFEVNPMSNRTLADVARSKMRFIRPSIWITAAAIEAATFAVFIIQLNA